jgi:hypothetical protein
MSVSLDLNSVNFQTSLRSKPVRENFTDIQNAVNDLQAQINALATPPAGTEVTNARDYHTVLRDRLRSVSQIQPKYLISGGVVSESTPNAMTVEVASGEAVIEGIACKWDAQTSGTITAPSFEMYRWDTIVINNDNTLSIVSGSESPSSPSLPSITSSQKKLAHIYLADTATIITDADIRSALYEPMLGYFQSTVPIGGVIPWHKSFASITLGDEWKECDGSLIDDPESPYYTLTIPDMNGGARFIKGAATSGTLQASANKAHDHSLSDPGHFHSITEGVIGTTGGPITNRTANLGAGSFNSTPETTESKVTGISLSSDGETSARPDNITMVYIMRIK